MRETRDGLAVNTYSYTQSMQADYCLRHLADLGIRRFELMMYPGHLWHDDGPEQYRAIQRACLDANLELLSLNSPNIDINIAAAAPEMRAYSTGLLIRYIQTAAALDIKFLVIGPGKPNPLQPMPEEILHEHFYRALDQLLPVAQVEKVILLVENMPFSFLPKASGISRALDRYGSDDVKVCYDLANAHFVEEDVGEGLAEIGARLRLIHVSDTTRRLYVHAPIGAGDMDFSKITPQLSAANVPYVLEIISNTPDEDVVASSRQFHDFRKVDPETFT